MFEVNTHKIRQKIAQVCARKGYVCDQVQIVCVTKTVGVEEIEALIACGEKIMGENRVQDLIKKYEIIGGRVQWHLIGHLQTNKVKDAVRICALIHSVDSFRLAQKIAQEAAKRGKTQEILVEVNTSAEASKYGVKKEEVISLLEEIAGLSSIKIMGLMTMAPIVEDSQQARPYFHTLRLLAGQIRESAIQNVEMKYLSMGMSQDYEVAVEEGANLVRIGRALFDDANR